MKWEKSVENGLEYKQNLILLFTIVLVMISVSANRPLLMLPVGFFCIWILASWFLTKSLGKNLELSDDKRLIRIYQGEYGKRKMVFRNESAIPYIGGFIGFSTNQKIESLKFRTTSTAHKTFYRVPIFISGKSEAVITFPFYAKERGVIRITNIEFFFPHLLTFHDVLLRFKKIYGTEIVVYPKPIPVGGIENFPYIQIGNQTSRFSPFEDTMKLQGTKEYSSSDPFNRIHWKASAKEQKLQSKLFERDHHVSWAIMINVAQKSRIGNVYISPNTEKYISQAAYLCQVIIKQGFPVALYINSKGLGARPYVLESGTGIEHLKKIMEYLARFDESTEIMDIGKMLEWVDYKSGPANLIAIIGEVSQECSLIINKWDREGRKILHVVDTENGSYLTEIKNERFYKNVK